MTHHQKTPVASAYSNTPPTEPSALDTLLAKPLRLSETPTSVAKDTDIITAALAPIAPAPVETVPTVAPAIHGNPKVASKWANRIAEKPGTDIDRSPSRQGKICYCGDSRCTLGPFQTFEY